MRKSYKILKYLSYLSLVLSIIILFMIIIYIIASGYDDVNFEFMFGRYDSTPSIFPAIIGTFRLILISICLALPIGVSTSIFLVEYMNNKGKIVSIIRLAVETLAGIPSIVYGLFGYLIFVVYLEMGYTILGGGITLTLMILPLIVRQTEESLLAVPALYKEGAYALGASKVRTIFKVILPSASSGIVTSLILSIGRVVSESAVLLLTIGRIVNKVPVSNMSPGTSLALDIYYFSSVGDESSAAGCAFVLLILILLINLLATSIKKIINKKYCVK